MSRARLWGGPIEIMGNAEEDSFVGDVVEPEGVAYLDDVCNVVLGSSMGSPKNLAC